MASEELNEFASSVLYPRLFESIPEALPEFDFVFSGGNWVSTNKHRVSGEDGQNTGSVYVYADRPYLLVDFSRGSRPITTYLQDCGRASSWIDAMRQLAAFAGVSLPSRDLSLEERGRVEAFEKKSQILEATNDFFIDSLSSEKSVLARTAPAERHREYLAKRGYVHAHHLRLPGQPLDHRYPRMELGFMASSKALFDHLQGSGFSKEDIDLCFFRPDGAKGMPHQVGTSHQLTVPFRDLGGRILGFAFRYIDWSKDYQIGKYLYSVGLQRKAVLFNLRALRGEKDLVVVEGLLDALHARALGMKNVVALGGTSLSVEQLQLARKCGAENLTLCLDSDEPGQKATQKAIELIRQSKEKFSVYVGSMPDGFKDPDELMRHSGVKAFEKIVKAAKAHYLWSLDKRLEEARSLFDRAGELDDKDRDEILADVVKLGAQASGYLEHDHFMLAFTQRGEWLGVGKDALEATVDELRARQARVQSNLELKDGLARVQELLAKGQDIAARDVLGDISKQDNTAHLEASFRDLLKPTTEADIRAVMASMPESLDSGLAIDGETLWLPSGAITVVAGPTSHGKTTMLMNMALNVAKTGKATHLFSYEEAKEQIFIKTLNTYIGLDFSANNKKSLQHYFRTGDDRFFRADSRSYVHAKKEEFFSELIEPGCLRIHSTSYNPDELVAAIRSLHKAGAVDAVFIDYIQLLIDKTGRPVARHEALKQICLDLKTCAVETGLPIILGAQFNRTVTSKEKLFSTNIGEAGDIERSANLILGFWNMQFANQDDPNKEECRPNEIFAKVLKGRDIGAGASDTLHFNGNTGKISNIRSGTKL